MFAEAAFAELPFAGQGIIREGVQTMDANFTQTSNGIGVFSGVSHMIGTFSKLHAASGILVADIEMDANFTQTTTGTYIGVGVSEMDANFTQTTAANRVKEADASMDANFTQTTTAIRIALSLIHI